jgi:hypothetical protein
MPKVKDTTELFDKMRADVVRAMDSLGYHLFNYVDSFVYNAYRKECPPYWPIINKETEEPIKNPDTGQEYTEEENPAALAHMLRSSNHRTGEYGRIIKVWVDTYGHENSEALLKVGKLMEVHGCRPWSRLKLELTSPQRIKDAAERSRQQDREMVFGTK